MSATMSFIRGAKVALGALGAVALASAIAASASAAELKLAFFISDKHPIPANVLLPWAKEVGEQSQGALSLRAFPSGQIGGKPQDAYKRVLSGISDVEFGLQGYTSTVFPRTLVSETPLQWDTPSETTKASWRIFAKHIAQEYEGVKVIGLWHTDTPAIMTNKPVRRWQDLQGMKIRTPSDNQSAIIKAFGAVPVAMPVTELYNSLEKGVVDGAMIPMSTVRSFKLNEVVKYYTVGLPLGQSAQFLVMNGRAWAGLSDAEKAVIERNSGETFSMRGTMVYEAADAGATKMVDESDKHTVIRLSDAEKAEWNGKLREVVEEWVARFEERGVGDYRQLLADFAAKGS